MFLADIFVFSVSFVNIYQNDTSRPTGFNLFIICRYVKQLTARHVTCHLRVRVQKGPVLRINVLREVVNQIINIEMRIVCLKDNRSRVIWRMWQEIEVTAASQFVDLKPTPNRISQTNHRLCSE